MSISESLRKTAIQDYSCGKRNRAYRFPAISRPLIFNLLIINILNLNDRVIRYDYTHKTLKIFHYGKYKQTA